MKRVIVAACVAALAVSLPYLLDRWTTLDDTLSVIGLCLCAPLLPGVMAVLPIFDSVGVDFFDSSGDMDATGTVLMIGVSFITWFTALLLSHDVIWLFRRSRRTAGRRDG